MNRSNDPKQNGRKARLRHRAALEAADAAAAREAWAADTDGIGRAVYELVAEALALSGAIVPAPGEHASVRDLGDDLLELRIGARRLSIVPRAALLGRAAEIVRRAE